jgi:hypothetical protein
MICTTMEDRMGNRYLLAWQELLSCEHLAIPTAGTLYMYSSMSKISMRASTSSTYLPFTIIRTHLFIPAHTALIHSVLLYTVNKLRSLNLHFSSMFCIESKIVHLARKKSSRRIKNKFTGNLNIFAFHLMMRKITLVVKF